MTPCQFCESITIADLTVTDNYESGKGRFEEPAGLAHQPSWEALQESARTCELCSLISQEGVENGILPTFDPQFDEVPAQIARRNASQRLKLRAFRPGGESGADGLGLQGLHISTAQHLDIRLEIVADEDSVAAVSRVIAGRPINQDSTSTQTFDHIASWREICRRSHTRCSPNMNMGSREGRLPTRILFVGTQDSEEIRLSISAGERGRYAALSHRWGHPETTACTTTDNLESRIRAIPKDDLSQLFQDAIVVTRRLGLEYLWIDSLCILQNNREDWKRESVLMGDVYGNSEITISAVAAEDGSSGFLGPRNTCMVRTKYKTCKTRPSEGCMYFRRRKNRLAGVVRECALNNRAWVIQERILTPRILSFTEIQVFWECREMVAGEGGPQHTNMDHISRRIITTLQDLPKDQTSTSKTRLFGAWRQLVQEASEAGLTRESDRLYTIAGVSQLLQRELRTEYLCGTWMDDLALEINWGPQPQNGTLYTCRHPSIPRAPSWCWSSLEGPIRFSRNSLEGCTILFQKTLRSIPTIVIDIPSNGPLHSLEPSWALHVKAHVAICEVTLNGVLWRGPEGHEIRSSDNDDFNMATKGGGLATFNETGQFIGGAKFDLQPTKQSFRRYSCMLLLECTSILEVPSRRYGVGLLLNTNMKPLDVHQTYTRVGRVSFGLEGLDWLQSCEAQCVTLI